MAYTLLDPTVKFLRRITVETRQGPRHRHGRQQGPPDGSRPDARLLAHATSSCMIFPVSMP
jgi:hypothetical protein